MACTQPNPAFEGSSDGVADSTSTAGGDGDGDGETSAGQSSGTSQTTDNPMTGDGDGDGDGDPTTTGPSETETEGDGDGDPNALPACPETLMFELPVLQDTFLDDSPGEFNSCVVSWNFAGGIPVPLPGPCAGRDFGATKSRWVCAGNECSSAWLGEFDLSMLDGLGGKVDSAALTVHARVDNTEPVVVSIFDLSTFVVDPDEEYGECDGWLAGEGEGMVMPPGCVTTALHSAVPHYWTAFTPGSLINAVPLAEEMVPATNSPSEVQTKLVLPEALVQDWRTGEIPVPGIMLNSSSSHQPDYYLRAQGSDNPPILEVELCEP